ncbi:MAG TPA: PTS glucose transporter subunit IIBC [Gemmatimonadaceae bacterium]|jgi:PTS system glucose-specific IIC component|nr:PTS glucose transporter subunit IIBC [Gemmatimonadaceae bacterium]
MSFTRAAFGSLQKIGKSLMLPVSVLPAAGILLGVGSAKFKILPAVVSDVMAQAGGAIFGNLPLIFAIGVALGLTGNDGVAALAAVVGFAVMLATMGVMAPLLHYDPKTIMGIPSIETGVFGGILIGAVAAILFNRYYRLQLPAYLGFFAGKRSVPILTSFAAVFVGIVLSFVWPPIGNKIEAFSHWAATAHPATAFALYGVVERSLIPFGLHHIWNVPFFFEVGSYTDPATGKVIHGEINRFVAGDPTAGNLAGGYLFKMWGLPAAALAIWRTAKPENRARIGGIMISAALTSFLTGITEPIEFAFLFVAPVLYVIHALLAGAAYWVAIELGIHHSTTFSHGLIDYVVLYPHAQRGWWLIPLGLVWAAMYYAIFRTLIVKFNLKTPGRESDEAVQSAANRAAGGSGASNDSMAAKLVAAFGGASNIRSLDACITRLRLELFDNARANPDALRALGASGVMTVPGGMQAIFGTRSENLKTDMEEYMRSGTAETPIPVVRAASLASTAAFPTMKRVVLTDALRERAPQILAALGGASNIVSADAVALTRLRVELHDPSLLEDARLARAGVLGVWRLPSDVVHLIVGEDAAALAAALAERRAEIELTKA